MDPIARAAKIREALFVRGITFADIDRRYELPEGTSYRTAHREPNAKGEVAISATLAVEAKDLWPERYEASGQRKNPQPHENYERPPTKRQRRNDRAA